MPTTVGKATNLLTFSRGTLATVTDSDGVIKWAPHNLLLASEQFDSSSWIINSATIAPNTVAAPNDTMTADTLTATGFLPTIRQAYPVLVGRFTASFFVKPGTASSALIRLTQAGNGYEAVFTLTGNGVAGTPTIAGSGGTVSNMTSSITFLSNGWYYCSVSFDETSLGNIYFGCGVQSGTIHIWGAHLYRSDLGGMQQNGTVFPYYNSTTPKNLLRYSEDFVNSVWIKENASLGTNGVELVTNGTFDTNTTGWTTTSPATATWNAGEVNLARNSGSSVQNLYQSLSYTIGKVYAVSITVSALSNSVSVFRTGGGATIGTAITSPGTYTFYFTAASGDNGIYVGCGGSTSATATVDNISVQEIAAYAAPNGSLTAEKIVESTSTGGHGVYSSASTSNGGIYTLSAYAKAGERIWVGLAVYDTDTRYATFNLSTGAVGLTSGVTPSITPIGDGWYRCSITRTVTATTLFPYLRVGASSSYSGYTGDGTSGIYLWGAQVSDSASLDPYVPNFGAATSSAVYHGPRLDYDPFTLAPKGLLVEELRTNLYLNSETPATQVATLTNGSTYTISMTGGSNVVDLDETIAVTAVDVFVYDTSKDSDGGAWRTGALAQASSWYNETLNTATRGSRREFPAVAVIVAEAAKVTIYDGDDPSLPMWMVFNRASDSYFLSASQVLTSICMQNGLLVFGIGGTREINFVSDAALFRGVLGVNPITTNIAGRNSGASLTSYGAGAIVNNAVNDVAMTVLSDAPTDPVTGLPVPTIAVATGSGVSVITDDGAVYDSLSITNKPKLTIIGDYIFFKNDNSAEPIQTYRISTITGDGFTIDRFYRREDGTEGKYPQIAFSSFPSFIAGPDTTDVAIGYVGGGLWKLRQGSTGTNGAYPDDAIAKITSTYNTGWLNGSIRGAFLSDISATNLVGSGELVTNGGFDSDVSNWLVYGDAATTATYDAGRCLVTAATPNDGIYQNITTVIGSVYIMYLSFERGTVTKVQATTNASGSGTVSSVASSGLLVLQFKATSTSTAVRVTSDTNATGTFWVDNISVKLADADRSINNYGLIVNGTITRTAVATGAGLVAYSGFSTSNYLEQSYNPGLDFGTGDFCVMGWVKMLYASQGTFFDRAITARTGALIEFRTDAANRLVFFTQDSAGTSAYMISNETVPTGSWVFVVATRTASGVATYINAQNTTSYTSVNPTSVKDTTNTSAITRFGGRVNDSLSFAGSLALWRISGTAPTAAQILKIYNDEKVLFQNNAQATLYGASDAVTALAHDSDTNLLHVGTSAGRSIFQGLRRINNTTTAVSTAISATNGVIAEQ